MAKLVYPAVGKPYRGFVGEVRGWFNRIASYVEDQPGATTALNTQIEVLGAKTGFETTLPATTAKVTNGQQLVIPVTGTYATTVTLTVAGGAVTAAVLS